MDILKVEERRLYLEAFMAFDKKNNGVISNKNLIHALRRVGLNPTEVMWICFCRRLQDYIIQLWRHLHLSGWSEWNHQQNWQWNQIYQLHRVLSNFGWEKYGERLWERVQGIVTIQVQVQSPSPKSKVKSLRTWSDTSAVPPFD